MTTATPPQDPDHESLTHICVCICSYRRPDYLAQLLDAIASQVTNGEFRYSVVVVDNDATESARPVVEAFRERSSLPVRYVVEPQQNISRARNRAVRVAEGDFIAFIDDDEVPIDQWLKTLYRACRDSNADGALGPVRPKYETPPPAWVIRGKFYDRPSYPTGTIIDWRKGRTGNTLVSMEVFDAVGQPFDPMFLTGEDQDFFRRAIDAGFKFVWCHEAFAYEFVPPIRWNRKFMLKRALLRGKNSIHYPASRYMDIAKSLTAVVFYAMLLPPLFFLGQGLFMKYLVKLCDHSGKLLAYAGIGTVPTQYVTD